MKDLYIHNFACWAAARAVQNPNLSGTSTLKIRKALDAIDIYSYIEDPTKLSDYKKEHGKILKKFLEKLGWDKDESRFGAAAKVIAIYFKVGIIIPSKAPLHIINGIYPPIDSHNLAKIKGFKNNKWTKINEATYSKIIEALYIQLKSTNSSFIDFESENTFITK
jgi:hypothetical protein